MASEAQTTRTEYPHIVRTPGVVRRSKSTLTPETPASRRFSRQGRDFLGIHETKYALVG